MSNIQISYLGQSVNEGQVINLNPVYLNQSLDIPIDITNAGSSLLTITNISFNHSDNPIVTSSISYLYSIAVGDTITLHINLDTSTVGTYSGVIEITDDSNDVIPLLSLNVSILSPLFEITYLDNKLNEGDTLDYGSVRLNQQINKVLILSNKGNTDLTLSSISLPQFIQQPIINLPYIIPSLNQASIVLEIDSGTPTSTEGVAQFTFDPPELPPFTFNIVASVTSPIIEVYHNSLLISQHHIIDFGLSEGEDLIETLLIKNIGNQSLTINSLVLPPAYSTSTILPIEMGISSSLEIPLLLSSITSGTYQGQVLINSDAYQESQYILNATGIISLKPLLNIYHGESLITNGHVIEYASIRLNSVKEDVFTLLNSGKDTLTIESISLPDKYSLRNPPSTPHSINPDDTLTLDVILDTSQGGNYIGDITILSNDENTPSFNISLSSSITIPLIEVTYLTTPLTNNSSINEEVEPDDVVHILIYSKGNQPLSINNIAIPPNYHIPPITFPYEIHNAPIVISLDTSESGIYDGVIQIDSDDIYDPTFLVNVSFDVKSSILEITYLNSLIKEGDIIDFGSLSYNSPSPVKVLNIRNIDINPITINSINTPSSFNISIPPLPLTLNPSTNIDLSLDIDTSIPNVYEGNLILELNNLQIPTFNILLRGLVTTTIIDVLHSNISIPNEGILDFGEIRKSDLIEKTITINNIGSETLLINSIELSPNAVIQSLTYPLSINTSINLIITFDSDTSGDYVGELIINSNAYNHPQYKILLNGTVISPLMKLSYEDSPLDNNGTITFGIVELNTSNTIPLSLINEGNGELTIPYYTITSPYSINQLPSSILPNQTIPLTINLDGSTPGLYERQLIISSDDEEHPTFILNLSAQITYPLLLIEHDNIPLVNNSTLDFGIIHIGTVTSEVLIISNGGDQNLFIEDIQIPDNYVIESLTVPFSLTPNEQLSLTLIPNTDSLGTSTEDLIILSSNYPDGEFIIHLQKDIVPVPSPLLEINQDTLTLLNNDSLDFSTSEYGADNTKVLTITNRGNADLIIESIDVPQSYISSSDITVYTLVPNTSTDLAISINNLLEGTHEGVLTINSNDKTNPIFNIALSGIVNAPYSELLIRRDNTNIPSGDSLDLGSTSELISKSIDIELFNIGTGPLTINSIDISTGFSTNLFVPTVIEKDSSLTVELTLHNEIIGIKEGHISLSSDDRSSPYLISLRGEVLGIPSLLVTYNGLPIEETIDLGRVERRTSIVEDIVLTNNGTAILTLSNLSTSNVVSISPSFPLDIQPNESLNLSIFTTLSEDGLYEETLSFDTNIPSTFSLQVRVLIYSNKLEIRNKDLIIFNEETLDFGEVINEGSIDIDLINKGETSLLFTHWLITSPFTFLNEPPMELSVSQSYLLKLGLSSEDKLIHTGTLTFNSNNTDNPTHLFPLIGTIIEAYQELSVYLDDIQLMSGDTLTFGSTPTDVAVLKNLIIKNTGNIDVAINGISLSTDYIYEGPNSFVLSPDEEASIDLSLLSSIPNIYQADFYILGDITFNLLLEGEVFIILEPAIQVIYEGEILVPSINSIDFGSTLYREPVTRTISITNTGTSDLILNNFINNEDYTYLGPDSLTISPNVTQTIDLHLNAIRLGESTSTFSFNTNVPNNNLINISLKGEVLASKLQVIYQGTNINSGDIIDFGTHYEDILIKEEVVLVNNGTSPLVINSILLPEDYSLVLAASLPLTIDEELSIEIQLNSLSTGEYEGELTINSNDPESPLVISLRTNIQEAPFTKLEVIYEGLVISHSIDLERVSKEQSITKTLGLTNRGNINQSIISIEIDNPVFNINLPSLPIVITPTSILDIDIDIDTNTPGDYQGLLTIIDSEELTYTISLKILVEGANLTLSHKGIVLDDEGILDYQTSFLTSDSLIERIDITNNGNRSFESVGITIVPPLYKIISPLLPISPEGMLSIDIELTPLQEGDFISTLLIDDYSIELRAKILPPLLSQVLVDTEQLVILPTNTPIYTEITNNNPYPLTITSITSSNSDILNNTSLPITIPPNSSGIIQSSYIGEEQIDNADLDVMISTSIGHRVFDDLLKVALVSPTVGTEVLSVGASDPLNIPNIDEDDSVIITRIPSGIRLTINDNPVGINQPISLEELLLLTVSSIQPGQYQIGYRINNQARTLDITVESGPLVPANNETGFIPIPKYEGLYPTSPYWIEGDTYWVLVEPGMRLSTTPNEPTIPPANLVLDTISKVKEPSWRNDKPLTTIKNQSSLYIVGTIDRALMSRDIFLHYSVLPQEEIITINNINLYETHVLIEGVTYTLSLTPGLIRVSITPNSIRIINNGLMKKIVNTSIGWLSRGSIYTIEVDESVNDLLVTVDESGSLIDTYLQRKYSDTVIPLLTP